MDFLNDPRMIAPRDVIRTMLPGGGFELASTQALQPYARCVGEWLERWAHETPDALAFAEPTGVHGWATVTWEALRSRVGRVAQGLLDLALPDGKPIVALSDNAVDQLVLLLAGMHVGRVHRILQALDPALVYASRATTYGDALADSGVAPIVVFSEGAETHPGAIPFEALCETVETPAVMEAFERITPDTHAKYLLTSGSTGHPKVVINTHRMLCANQQMLAQTLRFLDVEKPVIVDWLPWSHTFGANHNVNLALRTGGSFYIDDGRPMPGAIERTLAHLRDVAPTVYFNVPRGYEMLLQTLESDASFARHFFGRLRMLFYSGAGMPVSTWQRLERVAARVRTEPLWLTTSWGSTETAPANTFVNWRIDGPGVIGLPLAGVRMRFVPNGDKLEMRLRGDHIFPGYRNDPTATRDAFDADGFYRIGDAGCLVDDEDPLQGVVFDGRIAEDFKLTSGTWVSVGTLRLKVVSAMAPHVQDVVVTGHDRNEIGLLLFVAESGRSLPTDALADHVRRVLRTMANEESGSSQTPTRALLLADAPSVPHGELTDKGYLNQRLVLGRRAADIEALYASSDDPRVVLP